MGAAVHESIEPGLAQRLHQWLWREAGGFGARIVLLTVEAAHENTVATLYEQFATWECDQLVSIVALNRASAANAVHAASVEQATGIVLVGDTPMQWAATLGGTPLAQAIRRANARSKLVAGIGAVSAFLCQHIISPGIQPTTLRGAVSFGPGLGLVNKLVVEATTATVAHSEASQRRLLAAVATNPFLIGVGLAAGSTAILYPENMLQASGPNTIAVVDGQSVEAADLDAESIEAIVGASHHVLHMGDGFNLDEHIVYPAGEIDLPPTGPVTSVF
jgi:cyanophycinase